MVQKSKPGSIKSFDQLCGQFVNEFRRAMTTTKNSSSLLLLKYRRDETLKSFIKRYHEEDIETGALTHPLALQGLKNGLRMDK